MSDNLQSKQADLSGVDPAAVLVSRGMLRRLRGGDAPATAGAPAPVPGDPSTVLRGSPPCGITGDKVTSAPPSPSDHPVTLKPDWFQTTHPISMCDALAGYVSVFLGEPEKTDQGVRMFRDGAYRWPSGGFLAWDQQQGRCWLSLSAQSVNMIGPDNWLSFCRELRFTFEGRGSRIDLAADFWAPDVFSMDDVRGAAEAGDFTGFQVCEPRAPLKRRRRKMVREGDMVTFGRRGNKGKGAYFRFYDKALETRGEYPSRRVELETSGKLADMVLEALASSRDNASFARKIAGLIVGQIDFVRRGNHRNLSRMKRLDWWARAVELLGKPWELVALRVTPSIERKLVWIKQQVAPTLAYVEAFCDSLGVSMRAMVEAVLVEGRDRVNWTRRHKIDATFDPANVFPALPAIATLQT